MSLILQPVKRLRPSLLPFPGPHCRRYASTNTSRPKQRIWLRGTIVTAVAVAIGGYVRYQQDSSSATLNPYTFTQYELVSKTPVSSTSSIFTLRPVKPGDNDAVYKENWQRGLWSVQFKQPQLQIGRDYTPLPPVEDNLMEEHGGGGKGEGDGALRFLIRKDPHGEVSGYLHNLPPGAKLDIRGPRLDYIIPAGVDEILFIAGGTGIAPALQAAYTLFRNNKRADSQMRTKMHILWANRRREDCLGGASDTSSLPSTTSSMPWWKRLFSSGKDKDPSVLEHTPQNAIEKSLMVQYLEGLKAHYPDTLTVDYFVDEEGLLIGTDSILNFTKPDGENGTRERKDSPRGRKLILVSGPDGFISYMAGPKMWSGGKEIQGPLQGLIRQLNLKDWSVWKL
ncbi:hypothetical protein AJ78_07561 [Emergomyces pasteurianus Ep9510]|uniref:FAD-binding FR-type domain-containing protein n=1 Tax=Emergomyces pasteurianus Ep9510 TaxID=1447872 RepID=A0A1J9Q722_9EURO|nr:hypothetical protein AJ78_07561 [Emergomyces pasteurianus Ep9510]